MATFVVTNTNDAGAGSLREAITDANATPAVDVIQFAVGSGSVGISLQSPLTITRPVTIDATTQPGYAGTPLVRLNDGNNVGTGISLTAAAQDSVLRGLSITGFGNPNAAGDGDAISVGATNVTIEKCYIGLRPDGGATANEGVGVFLLSGGTNAKLIDNVISGNGSDGVSIYATGATLTGNIIGMNPTGSALRPNGGNGVLVRESNTTVGGGDVAVRNVISGNALSGIRVWNPNAANVKVYGNHIGLSRDGNAMFANGDYGVRVDGGNGVAIGTTSSGYGNRFGGDGVILAGNTQTCYIQSNTFGIGVNSIFDVGDSIGVNIDGGSNNLVRYNTVGRLDTGIRLSGFKNRATSNYVGITDTGAAIPNVLGITTQGSDSSVEDNVVANNTNFGVWAVSGSYHVLMNKTWNNGQSVWVSNAANTHTSAPEIDSIVEQPNGEYKVTVRVQPLTAGGEYHISFYQSDSAGNPISGDTFEGVGPTIGFTSTGYVQNVTGILNTGPAVIDGKFLTAVVVKELSQFNAASVETSQPSPAVEVVGSPSALTSNFEFETKHAWSFTFSENVGASINASDLRILNYTTQSTYAANSVTWDSVTKTARWTRNTPLPDGDYIAVLDQGKFANAAGVTNKRAYSNRFFVLAGDANRDQTVNFDDLLVISQNYGTTGKTFSQGNFNYDAGGNVNFDDLLIVSQRYGTSLFSESPVSAIASPASTSTKARRAATTVL